MQLYDQDPNLDLLVSAKIKRPHQKSLNFPKLKRYMQELIDNIFRGLAEFIMDDELVGLPIEEQVCQAVTIHSGTEDVNTFKGMMNLMLCIATWSDIVFTERAKSHKNSVPVNEIRVRLERIIYMTRVHVMSQYQVIGEAEEETLKSIQFLPQFALQLVVRFLSNQGIFIKWIETVHQIDIILHEERENRLYTHLIQKDQTLLFKNHR